MSKTKKLINQHFGDFIDAEHSIDVDDIILTIRYILDKKPEVVRLGFGARKFALAYLNAHPELPRNDSRMRRLLEMAWESETEGKV